MLIENPAFQRAYREVFNRLLTDLLQTDNPDSTVYVKDKMLLLDRLIIQLNGEATAEQILTSNDQY